MNREYKSDVFSMLLEDPIRALDVYNALNNSNYTNPDDVLMTKLESGVSLSLRNDASFIIDMNINLYEHQSTYNPNMPLRNLIYLANIMEKWIKIEDLDIYSRRKLKIPVPHFAVFYNGPDKRPDIEILKLSDLFAKECEKPEIELICTMYNINKGHNNELKASSSTISKYMYFIDKVCYYKNTDIPLTDAINNAIDDCIGSNILTDFFKNRRDEVVKVTELDFTWERREELIRKEEYDIGVQDGHKIGVREGHEIGVREGYKIGELTKLISQIRKKILKEKSIVQIADELETDVEDIKAIYQVIQDNFEKNDDAIVELL